MQVVFLLKAGWLSRWSLRKNGLLFLPQQFFYISVKQKTERQTGNKHHCIRHKSIDVFPHSQYHGLEVQQALRYGFHPQNAHSAGRCDHHRAEKAADKAALYPPRQFESKAKG